MADINKNVDIIQNLFAKVSEHSDRLVNAWQRINTAISEATNNAKNILPVIEELTAHSEEQILLEEKINELQERRGQLTEEEKSILDSLIATQAAKQSVILAQGEKYFETLTGTTRQAIELEKNFRNFVGILSRSGKEGKELAKQIISMKASKEAKDATEKISDNLKTAASYVLNLEKGLFAASGFFAKMSLNAFLTSVRIKDLSRNLVSALGGKGGGGEGGVTKAVAEKTGEKIVQGAGKTIASVGAGIASSGSQFATALGGVSRIIPGIGIVLSLAIFAMALDLKYARTRISGAFGEVNAALGRFGSTSGALSKHISIYGNDFLKSITKVKETFLAEDDEAQRFILALNSYGISINQANLGMNSWRRAQLASGLSMEEFANKLGSLIFATGVTGSISNKLLKALDYQYTATGKAVEVQKRTGISLSKFREMWEEASSGLSQYVQDQDYLLNAVQKAAIGLDKMGFNATTAGSLISNLSNTFANVNEAIKVLSVGGGLESLFTFEGMKPGEKSKAVMSGPVGQLIRGMGSSAMQMLAMRSLLGIDYQNAYKAITTGILEVDSAADTTARKIGERVGAEIKKGIEETAGGLQLLSIRLANIEKHIANLASGGVRAVESFFQNGNAWRVTRAG